MMRFDTFGRTVVFGAVAAIGWLPWLMLAAPLIGMTPARTLYLMAVTAVYIAGLSSSPRRLLLAVAALAGAAVFVACAGTSSSLVVMLAVILGVARSGFLYAAPVGPAVVREVILLASGLLLARFVGGTAAIPTSGALWAFFLVQALFFLMPRQSENTAQARVDPFDAAYRRALGLLDERA